MIGNSKIRTGRLSLLLKSTHKGKFDEQYVGPYTIIEVLSKNNIKINTPSGVFVLYAPTKNK